MKLMSVGSGLLALTVLTGAILVGCVSSSDGDNSGSGGASGTSGGAGGVATGTGGKTTTGSGGAVNTDGETGAVVCGKAQELITDFTYDAATAKSTSDISFGDFTTTFSGGTYVYPNGTAMYPLTSDVTKGNWHVTGMVGDYSGLGFYFGNNCTKVDVSAFSGISFTVSGTMPTGMSTMKLQLGTAGNDIPSAWLKANEAGSTALPNFGRCTPASTNKYDGSCSQPSVDFSVTSTATTVSLKWADFKGGKPEAALNPKELVFIGFILPPPAGVSTAAVVPYSVDVTIDDLKFVP